jgi:hypothetical protein
LAAAGPSDAVNFNVLTLPLSNVAAVVPCHLPLVSIHILRGSAAAAVVAAAEDEDAMSTLYAFCRHYIELGRNERRPHVIRRSVYED